jgi:hypothetical protein
MHEDLDVGGGDGGVTELDALRDHALLVGAAQVAAAEVEKHRSAFAQAVDSDRLSAEALGWCQGLAPAHERPYYFHPERPTEVLFSVDDLRALIDGHARALREAELEKLAAERGPLFADIERCIIIRAAQTVEQEYSEARSLARAAAAAAAAHEAAVLAAAIPAAKDASGSEEADALEVQASEARGSAASSQAEAREAAKAGDFAAAVALKAKAAEAEKRASELDEQALQCRAEAAERMISARVRAEAEAEAEVARVAARRDDFYLPATLEERCAAEVARLQACRDSSIDAGDYEAAGQDNDKAKAYASLVPKLQGLAWMQWHREDMEAARMREEVESLRHNLAMAEAKARAEAEARAQAEAEKAKAQAETEKAQARAKGRLQRLWGVPPALLLLASLRRMSALGASCCHLHSACSLARTCSSCSRSRLLSAR